MPCPRTHALAWLAPLAVVASVSTSASAAPPPVRYDGHAAVRTWPTDDEALRAVLSITDDVWTERVGVGPVDVRLSPEGLAALAATGIDYEVRIADLQVGIDEERARLSAAPDPAAAPGAWFSDFKDVNAVDAYLDTLAAEVPDLVTVQEVGSSLDGRPIRALRITAGSAEGKAAVFFTGTQHAREWLSPMTVMCIADTYARAYGTNPRITDVLDAIVLYVIPMVNPDGYAYSWNGDRYWRKNTRGGYGVDLNRNWGYQWGGDGSSGSLGDETFRGDAPFSEPETQAVKAFVESKPEGVAFIDFHSFAELVLYPWGYQYGAAPDDVLLAQIAGEMASAIESSHGNDFQPIQGSDLYPASGVIDDWAYGEHGMMAFTIELRGSDFVIGPQHIVPSCEENLEASLVVTEWATQFSDPPSGGDGGGTGEPGGDGPNDDHGGDDVPQDDDGDDGDDDDGTGFGDDDDDDGDHDDHAEGDDDDGDDGLGLPGALPPGFGMDGQVAGCGCRSRGATPSPALLLLVLLARRRRRFFRNRV